MKFAAFLPSAPIRNSSTSGQSGASGLHCSSVMMSRHPTQTHSQD